MFKELPKDILFTNQEMKDYTTFKIGGPVDLVIKPTCFKEIQTAIKICYENHLPYYIIGNGSNLLVADEGLRGVVIQIGNGLSEVRTKGNQIIAQAGALLSKIAVCAMQHSLTGFEFAHGIPGTLGGAVVMNAGAYGGELKQVLVSCDVLDEKGHLLTLKNEELEFGYRTSIIKKKNYIVLGATLELKQGDEEIIKTYMKELMQRRKDKQPLDKPSAGSTFKRPEGYFAGKLIMDSGLRGYKVGGAMVSEKHCGFVVNANHATFKDVETLIQDVQRIVKDKFGVMLEPEVKILK